jgi:hypothetical protein
MKTKSLLLAHSAGMAMLMGGGGINRIASFGFGPRIVFEKPNEGKDADAISPEDIEAIEKKLAEIGKQVKEFGTEFITKAKAGEKITSDLKENVDKALSEQGAAPRGHRRVKKTRRRPRRPRQGARADSRPSASKGGEKPDAEKTPANCSSRTSASRRRWRRAPSSAAVSASTSSPSPRPPWLASWCPIGWRHHRPAGAAHDRARSAHARPHQLQCRPVLAGDGLHQQRRDPDRVPDQGRVDDLGSVGDRERRDHRSLHDCGKADHG